MSVPQPRKRAEATPNLDAPAWIEAALDALAEGGIDAVRIDPLAKKLSVTRGSFYWHFKDRAALHQAMLRTWRERASYTIFNRIERDAEAPDARMERLLALPYSSPRSARGAAIELAIRLWARRDKNAAKAVRHIDRTRLDYFARLMRLKGHDKDEARRRAFLFYAGLMAEALIFTDDKQQTRADLERALLGDKS
jgi:AcrR family transcriptional regulator